MPKKLAITISGAVSLGCYEAGVLYEVIEALRQHNNYCDDNNKPDDKVFIDVITGASAGGMTATLAVQKLLLAAEDLQGPKSNAFYNVWVKEISLDRLFNQHGSDSDQMSILSSQTILDIATANFLGRYHTTKKPSIKTHPAVGQEALKLGLALSNLNGIDYALPLQPKGKLIYTRFKDELKQDFNVGTPSNDDNKDFWQPLLKAAVACGAFPFAFRAQELTRNASEYSLPNIVTKLGYTENFTYTDGGVFQNEPLSLAKELVDEIDNHFGLENRFFLFVAPQPTTSNAHKDFNENNATLLNMAGTLASTIFAQSRFPGLILAEEKNEQVNLLNARAEQLKNLLDVNSKFYDPKAEACLRCAADLLLKPLFTGDTNPDQEVVKAQDRLKDQYKDDYNYLPSKTRDVWLDSILVLEKAAGLGETDEMTIYSIIADTKELAGYEFEAFSGFFDERYRDHDYNVGRQKAQDFLTKKDIFGMPYGLHYKPVNSPIIDKALNGLSLEKMDTDVRIKVRDRLINRFKVLLKQLNLGWLYNVILSIEIEGFLRNKLNNILKLPSNTP